MLNFPQTIFFLRQCVWHTDAIELWSTLLQRQTVATEAANGLWEEGEFTRFVDHLFIFAMRNKRGMTSIAVSRAKEKTRHWMHGDTWNYMIKVITNDTFCSNDFYFSVFLSESKQDTKKKYWSREDTTSWYLLHCKSISKGPCIYREMWKYFHATLQIQLQFVSLLHQFTHKCHKFPFQNSSLFFHHNPYSSSLPSLTPVSAVSLCAFHVWAEQDTLTSSSWIIPPRSDFGNCPFIVTLRYVFFMSSN